MNEWKLIAIGKLPEADGFDRTGAPCWSLKTIAAWINADPAEILAALPERVSERRAGDANDLALRL